jgi:transcription-repair coupling factor (superfamily II helicase)
MRVWDTLAALKGPTKVYEAPFVADVRLLAEACAKRGGAAVYVARSDRYAAMAAAAARFFVPGLEIMSLPAWDCLPYDRASPSPAVSAQRCAALARLASPSKAPVFVVTTASALVQRVPPRTHMANAALIARVGGDTPVDQVQRYLETNGYTRASTVR